MFVDQNLNVSVCSLERSAVFPSSIPRFYYSQGKPVDPSENDAALDKVRRLFSELSSGVAEKSCDLIDICKAINFPVYLKRPLYDAVARAAGHTRCCPIDGKLPPITIENFAIFWREMTSKAHDEASRFVFALAASDCESFNVWTIRDNVGYDDLISLVKDVIDTHPGMRFLAESGDFHISYIQVVVSRIFWEVNRHVHGRLSIDEFRRSNFLQTIRDLETITDINTTTNVFSYPHFYVIFSRFWDLDKDNDGRLTRQDLMKYSDSSLTAKAVDRIFTVMGLQEADHMDLSEFAIFMMAEEDKAQPQSIEFWFRCLDIDGDGTVTIDAMRHFYDEMKKRLDAEGIEALSSEDVESMLLDIANPVTPGHVTLADLKKCGLAHRFINTLVNVYKHCEQESENGELSSHQDKARKMSDWDVFCEMAYDAEL